MLLKTQFRFWCLFHELIIVIIVLLIIATPTPPPPKNIVINIFSNKKERNQYRKNFLILIEDVLNVSVIIGPKMAPSKKIWKFKSSKVYQVTERISIKQKFFFWWLHQTTSINVIIDSYIVFKLWNFLSTAVFQVSRRN